MITTETIKLLDKERVTTLAALLEGFPDDVQAVFDLTFLALVTAELKGVETDSIYSAISQQYSLAKKFANSCP